MIKRYRITGELLEEMLRTGYRTRTALCVDYGIAPGDKLVHAQVDHDGCLALWFENDDGPNGIIEDMGFTISEVSE